jgi:hypothetical protein
VRSVAGGGKLTPAEAVGVYRSGYSARLSEALGETFEACWRVLGDDDFLEACAEYARKTPSRSHNLSDYGSTYPAFLLRRFGKSAPFIGDLASLEWSYKNLFHAPAHRGLAGGELAARVKDASVLRFGSALALLSFKHRVLGLWRRDRSDDTPLKKADWSGPETALLYKSGGAQVFARSLAAPEAAALRALMRGRPLSVALASANGLDEAGARDLFSFLSTSGLVTEVR